MRELRSEPDRPRAGWKGSMMDAMEWYLEHDDTI